MGKCEMCRIKEANIHVTMIDGTTRELCRDCHNELTAELLDVKLAPFRSGIYEYSARNGKTHRFIIDKIVMPTGIGYEADEITENHVPGFKVAIRDGLDCDQEYLFYKLEAKIKYALSKKYLENGTYPNGQKYTELKDDEVAGRFEYDEENERIHRVVIDGKVFSWDELGRMLACYEGFQFKLQIFDITDEIT